MAKQQSDYISITELNSLLNATLEAQFPKIKFEGEVSEITYAKSGHLYLTIKDDKSQLSAVVWRTAAQSLGCKPARGMHVLCEGRPNVYHASGRLRIIVTQMVEAGEGALLRKFLELKAKLEKEGLFSPDRKRSLPFLPSAIGVVSSGTGAVIHDIMVRLRERMPSLQVYLVDVRVQGEGAAHEIAEGVRLLNEFGKVDVIIVARGGGSLEDLWAFNEEEVVRAIFASKIPVISGVGHEVDFSLSDYVADVRAPTPTAAAEMVVPHRQQILNFIETLSARILYYEQWLRPLEQRIDDIELRINTAMDGFMTHVVLRVEGTAARLKLLEPHRIIELYSERVKNLEKSLTRGVEELIRTKEAMMSMLSSKLDALSPYKVLKRGHSLVQQGAAVISNAADLSPSETISISFASGKAEAKILKIKE